MGEELVSGSNLSKEERVEDEALSSFSYTKQFYSYLPFFISIGMTPDQFWNDDVALCMYYRKAYEIQQERENEKLWLQGMYIYEALVDVAPIIKPMSKGAKLGEYPSEPYALTKKEQERRKERDERNKFNKMLEKMQDMVGRESSKGKDDVNG